MSPGRLKKANDFCRVKNANASLRTATENHLERPSKALPVSPTTSEAYVG